MLLNVVCWGAAFVAVKPAFDTTTPFRFLFYRHLLASVLVIPLFWHYRKQIQKLGGKVLTIIGIETIGSTIALSLLYAGLAQTTVLEAGLITTSLPLFITLGGIFLLKEKQEGHEWLGMLIAFAATLYLTVFPLLTNQEMSGVSIFGNVLLIASNVANLFYFPLAKKHYAKLPKLMVTSISFVVAAVSFFILSLFEVGSWDAFSQAATIDFTSPAVLFATFYMAVFGSIIGLSAYMKGQDGIESSEAGLFYYLQPIIYIPLAFIVLGEVILTNQVIALAVILVGVVIAERRTSSSVSTKK